MSDGNPMAPEDVSAAAENELVKLVNRIIVDAHRQGASDIHIEPRPGKEKTLVRFRKDGSLGALYRGAGGLPQPDGGTASRSCATWTSLSGANRRMARSSFASIAPLDIELRVATRAHRGRP
jgi:hypothetical protein